jgi:lipoyl(octanoyl) transferase
MRWTFINSGASNGKYNMDYDLMLARNFKQDEAVFRLYRWNPYCISLGANQPVSSINEALAEKDLIDITVRPTGGRAVLHSEELTYSVIYPLDFSSSARDIYNEINMALLTGLKKYDHRLNALELEKNQPNFLELYQNDNTAACFAVSAKSEIKYHGKKIVGSAQRKFEKVVLQHGSILCGPFHKRITKYLGLTNAKREEMDKEIDRNTADLSGILKSEINYSRLAMALYNGFEEYYEMTFSDDYSFHNNIIYSNN